MNYSIRVKHYPPEQPGPEDSFYNSQGQTLFLEKEPDLFTRILILEGGLPPSLKPLLYIRILSYLWEGDTFVRKIFGGKISKIGIYSKITIKKFLAFFKLLED